MIAAAIKCLRELCTVTVARRIPQRSDRWVRHGTNNSGQNGVPSIKVSIAITYARATTKKASVGGLTAVWHSAALWKVNRYRCFSPR